MSVLEQELQSQTCCDLDVVHHRERRAEFIRNQRAFVLLRCSSVLHSICDVL